MVRNLLYGQLHPPKCPFSGGSKPSALTTVCGHQLSSGSLTPFVSLISFPQGLPLIHIVFCYSAKHDEMRTIEGHLTIVRGPEIGAGREWLCQRDLPPKR